MLVLDKYGRVRLSIENASIFTGSPEEVSDRIKNLLKQHANSGKGLAPQVHILDGINLMDFSSLTAQEHISKAVHDELKKANTKNVATIVRVYLNRKDTNSSHMRTNDSESCCPLVWIHRIGQSAIRISWYGCRLGNL